MNGFRTRVLVVDDSEDAADSLAQLLGLWGHHAKACYSGSSALQIAQTFQPHVVLLDLSMPGMDGFQFARKLREQPQSQQAVLMAITGCSDVACRCRAWTLGLAQYLVKPIDLEKLRGLLANSALSEADFVPSQGVDFRHESVAEGQEADCW